MHMSLSLVVFWKYTVTNCGSNLCSRWGFSSRGTRNLSKQQNWLMCAWILYVTRVIYDFIVSLPCFCITLFSFLHCLSSWVPISIRIWQVARPFCTVKYILLRRWLIHVQFPKLHPDFSSYSTQFHPEGSNEVKTPWLRTMPVPCCSPPGLPASVYMYLMDKGIRPLSCTCRCFNSVGLIVEINNHIMQKIRQGMQRFDSLLKCLYQGHTQTVWCNDYIHVHVFLRSAIEGRLDDAKNLQWYI